MWAAFPVLQDGCFATNSTWMTLIHSVDPNAVPIGNPLV